MSMSETHRAGSRESPDALGTRSKVFFAEGLVQLRTVRVTIDRADLFSQK